MSKPVTEVQHLQAYVFYTSIIKTLIWDPTMQ
jgi:hypothetical protein